MPVHGFVVAGGVVGTCGLLVGAAVVVAALVGAGVVGAGVHTATTLLEDMNFLWKFFVVRSVVLSAVCLFSPHCCSVAEKWKATQASSCVHASWQSWTAVTPSIS